MNSQLSVPTEDNQTPITCKWLHDQRILVYRLRHTEASEKATLDQWMTLVRENRRNWHPNNPYLVLHDYTAFPITQHTLRNTYRLARDFPPYLVGRIALATERTINENNRAVQRILSYIQPEVGVRQFRTTDAALDWLMDYEG